VRQAARAYRLEAAEVDDLVQRSRSAFVIINGEPRPIHPDANTPLRRHDGRLLTIPEWVERTTGASAGAAHATVPAKNPFKRASWNLTEQMLL
jgi:hypothetical protein